MTVRIALLLDVDDDEIADPDHDTGLTTTGYEDVTRALSFLGMSIVDGPTLAKPGCDNVVAV